MLGQGERRNKIKVPGSRKEGTKDVSATNENTYNKVRKANESKMLGGSSVRPLLSRFLKATRDEIDRTVGISSITSLIAHHCQSFDLSSLNWKVAWPNLRKSIAQAHL